MIGALSAQFAHMIHYRIIGMIWLLFGVVGVVLCVHECLRLLQMGELLEDNAVVSCYIGFGFCALAAMTSIGILRAKAWARFIMSTVAILLGLYLFSFLAMVGLEFGVLDYALSWFGIAFVAYTLTVIRRFRPQT